MEFKNCPKGGFTLVEIMITVAIIGLLAAMAIPGFARARETSQLNAIISNIRIIEGAKDYWALENKKGTGDVPDATDLQPYVKNRLLPTPVAGETYNINPVGTTADAKTPVKLGTYPPNSTITLP
jgi:prepilin-type N-terminal cleavage/methylation domain-containing protein